MAGRIAQLLIRSGWRMRCVDPPIAWMQLRGGPTVAVRLQLTCYLTSRWARAVKVQDLRLVLRMGERLVLGPWTEVTDIAGEPFDYEAGYQVVPGEAQHALAEFVIGDPETIAALCEPGEPVPAVVQAMLNDAPAFRKIADLDLIHAEALYANDDWRQIGTGRIPRTRRTNNPPGDRGD
jgi:hypothetical protein